MDPYSKIVQDQKDACLLDDLEKRLKAEIANYSDSASESDQHPISRCSTKKAKQLGDLSSFDSDESFGTIKSLPPKNVQISNAPKIEFLDITDLDQAEVLEIEVGDELP